MNRLPELTIAILTKNRPQALKRCLQSIARQKYLPERVVLIDTGEEGVTKKIITHFQKYSDLSFAHHHSSSSHLAVLRNNALRLAKTPWVAFIDDDCVLSLRWSIRAHQYLDQSRLAAVQGSDYPLLYDPCSVLNYLYIFYWKQQVSKNWRFPEYFTDTKNIVLNKAWLQENHISFDESRREQGGIGEDLDLGLQIAQQQGSIIYDRLLMIRHQEPATFLALVKKNKNSLVASASVANKWNTPKQFSFPFSVFLWRYLKKTEKLTLWQKVQVGVFHVVITFLKHVVWQLA